LKGRDVALFFFLNVNQSLAMATVARAGNVAELERASDAKIGQIKVKAEIGEPSLSFSGFIFAYPTTRESANRTDIKITTAPVAKTSRSANRRRIRETP